MFIFPVGNSKSDSSTSLSSPGLSLPEEPTSSRTRRTSISDMVQRYEAIGGSKSPNSSPPIVISKPAALNVATQATSSGISGRPPRLSQGYSPVVPRGNTKASSALPISDEGPAGASFPTRPRASPASLPRSSSFGHRDSIWTREVENPNSVPPRRSSPEKSLTLVTSDEPSILDRQNSQFSFSARKPTTPPPVEDIPQRSPSPDKPYQGVGRLIDQWQRKTADAEPDRNPGPRRGGFAAKRALPGLVGGGAGRGR